MNAEDPSEKPKSQPTPAADPTIGAGANVPQNNKSTQGNNSTADSNKSSKKKEPIKWAALIIAALLAFFFGLVSDLAGDTVKAADACYDTLTQYDETVSSDFFQLNHDFHVPVADPPTDQQWLHLRELARKYNTEIDGVYLRIRSKCPVTGPNKYLNENDVEVFNKEHNELSKNCFEALQCSDDQALTVQVDSANSTEKLIGQAGVVAQWGWLRRGFYALRYSW